jgi:hypothetical protein
VTASPTLIVAGFDAAHEAAVVVQLRVGRILRAADVLHREAEFLGVLGVGGGAVSRMSSRVGPSYQFRPLAAVDDHVAVERRHRDEADVLDAELGGEGEVVGLDLLVGFLRVIDQVHLVDGDDEVRDADQRGQLGVAAGLRQHALARVDQDDREVGGRRGGDHVAGVLLVARRVGDDVLARAGGEVAVGDVDGDALFALGLQAVGEQREVDAPMPRFSRCARWRDRVSARMVLVSNSRRPISVLLPSSTLPQVRKRSRPSVLDFSMGADIRNNPSFLRCSMEASLVWSSRRVAPRSVMVVVAVSAMILATVSASDSTGAVQVMSPTVRKRTCRSMISSTTSPGFAVSPAAR